MRKILTVLVIIFLTYNVSAQEHPLVYIVKDPIKVETATQKETELNHFMVFFQLTPDEEELHFVIFDYMDNKEMSDYIVYDYEMQEIEGIISEDYYFYRYHNDRIEYGSYRVGYMNSLKRRANSPAFVTIFFGKPMTHRLSSMEVSPLNLEDAQRSGW
ncbi:MAG: hypothetical protein LUE26_04520 [Alistipes sp.]|nr:hypothetical protein [Alistipes sp.]